MTTSSDSPGLPSALWAELSRRHPADPYAWALARRGAGDRPLRDLPPLAAIARDPSPLVVIQKSAQVGITELLVNRALHAADTARGGRGNVLMLMPTQNQVDDFSRSRVDRAIQESPYLRRRVRTIDPAQKHIDSMRLKRIGPGYLYLRGSDSRGQVASVDADLVILDEFDQMREGIWDLAQVRLASSREPQLIVASTPRFPEAGVNALFRQFDQHHYHLPCPRCGVEQPLTWDENIDREQLCVICRGCRAPMDVLVPGRWIPDARGNAIRGYHLSRLYSPWLNLPQLIAASESSTASGWQEFFNSGLGEVFSPPGGGLSLKELDSCRAEYTLQEYAGQPCAMGVDVGRRLHVVIRDRQEGRLWYADDVSRFDELDPLFERFHVERAVVDAQPETREAVAFASRHRLTGLDCVLRVPGATPGGVFGRGAHHSLEPDARPR